MNLKKYIFTAVLAAFFTTGAAEAPAGYYSRAENKNGRALLEALEDIVGPHTTISYDGLLSLYKTSDVYPNGKIWDMYSTKQWNYGNTCGNYSNIGDCYNREHSFPKSWFSNRSPMSSDAFHIYPTDGKVNGQRSNYPYGECANGTYVATHNGVRALGRLGASTFPGYSGRVFEPDDEYKGDFARSYFYMAAAYNNRIGSWNSDMLAGNSFPAFSQWAINLLLKWHRQDPVSEKERDRNEVVYGRQRNRNPFIDYPDLAEHIWGNKSTVAWTSTGVTAPEILLPADGTTVDFGVTAAGYAVTRTVNVRTSNATSPVTLTVSGTGFSASTASIAAANANSANGANITLTYLPASNGSHTGTLTVATGSLSRTVTLRGTSVDGLPAGPARYITDCSFQATWTYVGDDNNGNYTLTVGSGSDIIDGYPRAVAANAGTFNVTDLDPSTPYWYTVASSTMVSDRVELVTSDPIPSIEFLFDGTLFFNTDPGVPSEPAEILLDVENIDTDITVIVGEPFELSNNRSDWSRTIEVSPDVERMYLRLNSATGGTFSANLYATAGSYTSEMVTVEGTAVSTPTFLEDFEADGAGFGNYTSTEIYQGTAAKWSFSNAGLFSGNNEPVHGIGIQSLRMGKNDNSCATMESDVLRGIGTISFWARPWTNDGNATLSVEVSTDGGENFRPVGTVNVTGTAFAEYVVHAGVAGKARIRLRQTAGKRLNIDDIAMTNYTSGVDDPMAARHQWDAFCVGGNLTVTVTAPEMTLGVYALDGTVVYYGALAAGEHCFDSLPAGLYIVASDDFSRRVIVR
ncbi:MAG: endonuclease [Muribaculaceae bacterium]|nr:endonuclease [Muribaculaceae bacterium]